jgi:hypothetical protein
MKHEVKLTGEQQQQQLAAQQQTQQQAVREFATAEELLRYDAAQTVTPPSVGQRLAQSSAGLTPPKRSWWQRLFNH